MREWLENLGQRERLLVVMASVVVVLLLVYSLMWSPFHTAYTNLQDDVQLQRETAQWMKQSAQRLQQLRQQGGAATRGLGNQSLLALTDSTARAQGLASALKRVEPEGSSNVKVWLENAAFDTLVQWLAGLRRTYGIQAETVTMERVADRAGRVNARLTLQAPES